MSVLETAEGEGFAGGEAQHRHFAVSASQFQQQNEVSVKGTKEQPPECVRFIPPLGQGTF